MSQILMPLLRGPARPRTDELSPLSRAHDPVTVAGLAGPAPGSQRRVTLSGGVPWGPQDWMSRGACSGTDTELFFPVAAPGRALQQVRSAKAVCVRCEVRASCLSYALETTQDGIWGGTTRDERIAMRPPRTGVR
jgi:WhiB family transcriptional regulator, redox-sensing transcriptional regulator